MHTFLVVVICAWNSLVQGEEPVRPQATDEALLRKYRPLVDAIVNRNKEPETGLRNRSRTAYPPDFDWAEDDRVFKSLQRLQASATDAVPVLLERITDKRYSMTYQHGEAAVNYDVGSICHNLLSSIVSAAYHEHMPGGFAGFKALAFYPKLPEARRDYPKWFADHARNGHSVVDIQIEAAEWAIGRIRELEGAKVDDKDASIEKIKSNIKLLRESGKCLPPRWIVPTVIGKPHIRPE